MLNHSDIDNTHEGWEAQKGIKNENENENEKNMNRLKQMMDTLGVTMEELRSGGRRQRLVDARSLVTAALLSQSFTRQQDVAQLLGLSQGAVSALMKRHGKLMESDREYQEKWKEITGEEARRKPVAEIPFCRRRARD